MKMSYYPGCSLEGTAVDYDRSVREVCGRLGVELVDIPDWNCCGASSAHMTDHETGIRLPTRNLLLAAKLGHDILVPCAACFQRLKAADKALREDPSFWDLRVYQPEFKIVHISTLLASEPLLAAMRDQVTTLLTGLPVACYYGCLSLRHPHITDAPNWEMPTNLEKIVEALGAEPVRWSHRTECCSGSLTMARPDIAERLVGDIVEAARRGGAWAMVTDCPMCQANVESRQPAATAATNLPVFYATELISAALTGTYPQQQQRVHLAAPTVLVKVLSDSTRTKEAAV
jgi:heterodisulfide reductase subunit B